MAKAIYALKIQLLYDGNEYILNLRAKELRGLQRFNKFVVIVYIQSWYTCRSAADAAVNDIDLIKRMDAFDDDCIRATGPKAMLRHSWYLGQELAKLSSQQNCQHNRKGSCCRLRRRPADLTYSLYFLVYRDRSSPQQELKLASWTYLWILSEIDPICVLERITLLEQYATMRYTT